MNRYAFLLLSIFPILLGAASCSTDRIAPIQRERTIKKLTDMCLESITNDHAQIIAAVAQLHAIHPVHADIPIRLCARRINNALLYKIGNQNHVLKIHTDPIASIALSPDSKTLAIGSWNGIVSLWDIATFLRKDPKELTGTLPQRLHTRTVTSLAFSPDNKTLASGSYDGVLLLWDIVTLLCKRKKPHRLQGHTNGISSLSFSPDSKTLASGSHDRTVRLWDIVTLLRQDPKEPADIYPQILQGHTDAIRSLAFSPDGNTLASGSHDRTVRLWDIATLLRQDPKEPADIYPQILQGHTDTVRSLAFSPDSNTLVSGSSDHTMRLWDLILLRHGYKACRKILRNHNIVWSMYLGHNFDCSLAFSPDGNTLASGSWYGPVRLWDHSTPLYQNRQKQAGTHHQTLQGHTDTVTSLAFNRDCQTLASASGDCTVRLWRLNYLQELETITDIQEQQFLLRAAKDWLSSNMFDTLLERKGVGKPHKVSVNNPMYQRLIERFPFLNDKNLFTVITPSNNLSCEYQCAIQ